ncbi:hypothetical protein OMR07_22475 [Methylobacterium organophilum]|nr:hypothetical protein [Methylobacterium organophilum]
MIAEVAAQVPDTLAAYRDGVAEGPGGPEALPLGALRDPDVFDATLAAFGAGFGAAFRTADPASAGRCRSPSTRSASSSTRPAGRAASACPRTGPAARPARRPA